LNAVDRENAEGLHVLLCESSTALPERICYSSHFGAAATVLAIGRFQNYLDASFPHNLVWKLLLLDLIIFFIVVKKIESE